MNQENPIAELSGEASSTGKLDPGIRESILRRFELWLDEVLARPQLPDGIATEILAELKAEDSVCATISTPSGDQADLHSLWSAMTVLSQEIKIQGRTFKQLNDTVEPLSRLALAAAEFLKNYRESLEELLHTVRSLKELHSTRKEEMEKEMAGRSRRPLLMALLDIRDRLIRGVSLAGDHLSEMEAAARASWFSPTGWLGWFFRRKRRLIQHQLEAVRALEEGYMLTLKRLDSELDSLGISTIEETGGPFDPHVMMAIGLSEEMDVPEGTVLEIYRAGYELDGEVLRPAEVKVAGRRSGARPYATENSEASREL